VLLSQDLFSTNCFKISESYTISKGMWKEKDSNRYVALKVTMTWQGLAGANTCCACFLDCEHHSLLRLYRACSDEQPIDKLAVLESTPVLSGISFKRWTSCLLNVFQYVQWGFKSHGRPTGARNSFRSSCVVNEKSLTASGMWGSSRGHEGCAKAGLILPDDEVMHPVAIERGWKGVTID